MHFAKLYDTWRSAAVLFTISIENLRFCSSADAGIAFHLFLNFKQK